MKLKTIQANPKANCCGCMACISICPKQCISIKKDLLSLSYPHIDETLCINCGECVKVCPFLNPFVPLEPKECFAAENLNKEILEHSSSGGVFHALASNTILTGGVVFGATFDKQWNVHHTWTDNIDGIKPMMGSKYTQSDIENSYIDARKFLRNGRQVLFSGTPCQIAGLKHYIKKDYPNLLAVEVICHGVPAPGIWQKYLKETILRQEHRNEAKLFHEPKYAKKTSITDIRFRDKRNGWRKYGLYIRSHSSKNQNFYEYFHKNPYMNAFLCNWSLRLSCYNCKAKNGISNADITLGDFWGIENTTIPHNEKGCSCVIIRSHKGHLKLMGCRALSLTPTSYNLILNGNPYLTISAINTPISNFFRKKITHKGFYRTVYEIKKPSTIDHLILFMKYQITRLKKFLINYTITKSICNFYRNDR